jgi:hypothetical protein
MAGFCHQHCCYLHFTLALIRAAKGQHLNIEWRNPVCTRLVKDMLYCQHQKTQGYHKKTRKLSLTGIEIVCSNTYYSFWNLA